MITCKQCGTVFTECSTRAVGRNLHTKVNDKDEVILSPEYYEIGDMGENHTLNCACGKKDFLLICDFCGRVKEEERLSIVTNKYGKRMVTCDSCIDNSSNKVKLDMSKIKLIIKE